MLLDSEVSKNYKSNLLDGNEGEPIDNRQILSDLGLTKNESSTYQRIASIPNDESNVFNIYITRVLID